MRGQLQGLLQTRPAFDLTPEQQEYLRTTTYGQAPLQDQRETIAARLYSGDSSAGTPSGDQYAYVNAMRGLLSDGGR